ncbi:hypothetical protein ASE67_09510 [Sphingomonas sp. Leaf23]|uniref:TonB-dependent receptor n=1 Tax=Sphingomonas sp. Leaf23 TaxID=1735689 RepID=UPI0006FF7A7B|nr:TonB-dependent receptor [Sphingomonas sp. Leaf23]KQM86091.1 hypothetical protein ASE67_09510 [Sphingomonas sp. Leaf23]
MSCAIPLACGWSLPAEAQAPAVAIDLPAGPIATSLTLLARQAGVSIGSATRPVPGVAPAIRGRMPVARALARLLAHSGWRARRVGPAIWRIERDATPPSPPRRPARVAPPLPPIPADDGTAEIVVTAVKVPQRLADAPVSVEIAGRERLGLLGSAPDTGALATTVNGLFTTNLGAGRDRLFVRGVADGPFDGFAQSSVSVYLGDVRATYDAPDPDLRLVDMQQVEVLKGPQGPLYGTGALGGVYRMVPAAPDATAAAGWVDVQGSLTTGLRAAGAVQAVANVPLVADRLAVRAVAYDIGQAGWIDQGGRRGVNHGRTTGGRLAVRGTAAGWSLEVDGTLQYAFVRDSQYVEGGETLRRAARLSEPQDTDFAAIGATATGPVGAATLTLTAGATWQQLQATYDASAKAAVLGAMGPVQYGDARRYGVRSTEARLAGTAAGLDWVVGVSLLDAGTRATGTLIPGDPAAATIPILRFERQVDEQALFGEVTGHVSATLSGTLGLRVFRSAIDDRRRDDDRQAGEGSYADRIMRASPSASLSWKPTPTTLVYARYASALRPGGVQAPDGQVAVAPYRADTLREADLGLRWRGHGGWTLDGVLFASRWSDVQADMLAADGLVSTRNIGEARNIGADVSIGWTPWRGIVLTAGVLAQHARIVAGTGGIDPVDRRLPVVPDLAGHAELTVTRERAGWHWSGVLRARFVGDARLNPDPLVVRETEGNLLLGAAFGARRGNWAWRWDLDNLTDSRADSFAFGNPFTAAASDQRTPLRPRTLSLSLRRNF